jgi:hypothetical protein
MSVFVKNTFLVVANEDETGVLSRHQRRNKTLPQEWKQSLRPGSACSDVSTACSPRSSFASSLEDASALASAVSCQVESCPCNATRIDEKTDAVIADVHSFLSSFLPAESIKIDKGIVEQSIKVLICVEAADAAFNAFRCYQLMQGVKQNLSGSVAYSKGLSLLSARLQKEDYGYSLRSSVACSPEDKENQMCWDVLRKGSCARRQFCRWYHPQACDTVRFKIVIRCHDAKAKAALSIA